jgi:nucleotide-binding universal stress UspA family protein
MAAREAIVCAVDSADSSNPVLAVASELANDLAKRLLVVHVQEEGAAPADLDGLRSSLGAGAADRRVEVHLAAGVPARAILEVAERETADLIVPGSRARGRLGAAVGSVSRAVATEAACPVVLVPSGLQPGSRRASDAGAAVVCGVDGSEEALAAATLAGDLARRLGWRVLVVHARQNLKAFLSYPSARTATPPVTGQHDAVTTQVEDVLRRALESAGAGASGLAEPGPPAEVLESIAVREDGRLIVVASRGAGGARAALLGSVASQLALTASCPVVVLSDLAREAAGESGG